MKVLAATVGGFAVAAAYVLINGILEIKASAMGWGVAVNLINEATTITGVSLAWLPTIAMAVLGALVVLLLMGAKRVLPETKTRTAFLLSFAATVLCMVVWAYLVEQSLMTVAPSETETGVGIARGVTGWVQAGGQAAVVQLVGLIALAGLLHKSPHVEIHPGKHPEAAGVGERP